MSAIKQLLGDISTSQANLTEFMHVPACDLATELLARIEHSNGLDMVDTSTIESLVDGLLLELFIRKHGDSFTDTVMEV